MLFNQSNHIYHSREILLLNTKHLRPENKEWFRHWNEATSPATCKCRPYYHSTRKYFFVQKIWKSKGQRAFEFTVKESVNNLEHSTLITSKKPVYFTWYEQESVGWTSLSLRGPGRFEPCVNSLILGKKSIKKIISSILHKRFQQVHHKVGYIWVMQGLDTGSPI